MPDGGKGAEGPAPVATPALKPRRRPLVTTLLALPALVATLVTGVLLAAGFNFGYAFHPVYLAVALIPLAAASGLAWTAFRAAGLRSRRLDLVTPVGIAALGLGIVVVLVVASAPDRGADERRNRALLAEAPPYPGASVVSVETFGEGQTEDYAAGFLNGADEYSTTRTDALPPGTTGRPGRGLLQAAPCHPRLARARLLRLLVRQARRSARRPARPWHRAGRRRCERQGCLGERSLARQRRLRGPSAQRRLLVAILAP